ncbi:exodeoxyribonuclease VII small subunit [Ponticaulis sp.]|uniref:exodeoxyribonuclease VII small subunit n=1 Tax=Ponticaulis sp. TaxID=2020902 RepID=UPI000B64C003|nr:exodeoxyribonuclease VII small subunit [Ponticaulis sp.]MAI89486.1 exodeoxyribonuclease VII small subunit [Ponticaulis sp.]OUY00523.1 MAG: exodeoxyribonuclease VII small subunit [Hyphomonadaceae bacterium TMED5]|tara:strand:- start:145427 stop:145672 length:246 start_codon:yes stop_codon:yes gene_type:complete
MGEQNSVESLSFEAALKELEGIVEKLEGGEVELEESIKIYERGAALKAHCLSKLKNAQLKVEQIVLNQDGEVTTQAAGIDG